MKFEDTPGLAMSRSLGDGLAHSVGVSSEPGKFLSFNLFRGKVARSGGKR